MTTIIGSIIGYAAGIGLIIVLALAILDRR